MTIGIAAHGPDAGLAVIRALAAVEAVGRGAIGGFVSFVALTADGGLGRACTQKGGSKALFGTAAVAMPALLATARSAALMSSGPERPEPLSQFTPADAAVGIVTGHRMPNTIGAGGVMLNDEVLDLMRLGLAPEAAVERVVALNPEVDAGIIALGRDGGLHAANTADVEARGDTGRALIRREDAAVAVLHNAIHPHRPLATLAAEVAIDVMLPEDRPDGFITFVEGIALAPGVVNAVDVGDDGTVKRIVIRNRKFLAGRWSLGIGYQTRVRRGTEPIGVVLYEPYMVVDDGRLASIDGQAWLSVPIRSRAA